MNTSRIMMKNQDDIFQDIINPFIPLSIDLRINTDPLISWKKQKNAFTKDKDIFKAFKEGLE